MNVLTTPIAIAATTAAQRSVRMNPGTIYSTTKRAKTFMASLIINSILLLKIVSIEKKLISFIMNEFVHLCQEGKNFIL